MEDGGDLEIIREYEQDSDSEPQERSEHIEGAQGNEEDGNGDEDKDNEDKDKDAEERKVVKPKKVVRNPQPKLDAELLKGPRGLMALQTYFSNKKFKGKGHEEEDLRTVMKTYEYWCHRMFPKYSFDDSLAKLEKLGTKKNVQTYLTRIRMDMVLEDAPRGDEAAKEDEEQSGEVNEENNEDIVIDLTAEQMERIRLNREKALMLRQERLKKAQERAKASLENSAFDGSSRGEERQDGGENMDCDSSENGRSMESRKREVENREEDMIEDDNNVGDTNEDLSQKDANQEEENNEEDANQEEDNNEEDTIQKDNIGHEGKIIQDVISQNEETAEEEMTKNNGEADANNDPMDTDFELID